MDSNFFLTQVGWPADRLGEAGQARWTGTASDDFSKIQATIDRGPDSISIAIDHVSIEKSSNMLTLTASIVDGRARVMASKAGEPPLDFPAEDAIDLFVHMREGLPKFKFVGLGPLVLPSKASPGR
jgi:hypothetical protein